MQTTPDKIRFAEVEGLLRAEGFILFNQRGSHQTWHRDGGTLLTIVKPHGGRKTCQPDDVRKLLRLLES